MGGNVISVTASELKLGCCQRPRRLEVEGLDAGEGSCQGHLLHLLPRFCAASEVQATLEQSGMLPKAGAQASWKFCQKHLVYNFYHILSSLVPVWSSLQFTGNLLEQNIKLRDWGENLYPRCAPETSRLVVSWWSGAGRGGGSSRTRKERPQPQGWVRKPKLVRKLKLLTGALIWSPFDLWQMDPNEESLEFVWISVFNSLVPPLPVICTQIHAVEKLLTSVCRELE